VTLQSRVRAIVGIAVAAVTRYIAIDCEVRGETDRFLLATRVGGQ
jgi:hypothetical protein